MKPTTPCGGCGLSAAPFGGRFATLRFAAAPPAAGQARRGAWPAARPARRLAGKYLLSASGLTLEYHPLASLTQRIAICRLCHSAFWEYNIIQEHDLAPHVAAGIRFGFKWESIPTGLVQLWTLALCQAKPGMRVLRAHFACRAAFARFFHAHELTGRALRCGWAITAPHESLIFGRQVQKDDCMGGWMKIL